MKPTYVSKPAYVPGPAYELRPTYVSGVNYDQKPPENPANVSTAPSTNPSAPAAQPPPPPSQGEINSEKESLIKALKQLDIVNGELKQQKEMAAKEFDRINRELKQQQKRAELEEATRKLLENQAQETLYSATPNHSRIVLNLAVILRSFIKKTPEAFCESSAEDNITGETRFHKTFPEVFSGLSIKFDEQTIFRPKISVVSDKTKMTHDNYCGAPELIVEILSPFTVFLDRIVKPRVYQKAGVKEYWIVDEKNKSLEQYVLKENAFELKNVCDANSSFNSVIFSKLQINLSDVFENVTD